MAAHDEAWAAAKARITKGREAVVSLVIAGLTVGALLLTGHKNDVPSLVVGGVVALVVGLLLIPGWTYIASRATYRSRTILATVLSLNTAIGSLGEPMAEQTEKAAERDREFLVSAQGIHEELLLASERWKEVIDNQRQPQSPFSCSQWDAHKGVLAQRPDVYKHAEAAMVKIQHLNEICLFGSEGAVVVSLDTATTTIQVVQTALQTIEDVVNSMGD